MANADNWQFGLMEGGKGLIIKTNNRKRGQEMEHTDKIQARCPKCNFSLHKDSKFCPGCGSAIPASTWSMESTYYSQISKCPGCGAELVPKAHFCHSCGRIIDAGTSVENKKETKVRSGKRKKGWLIPVILSLILIAGVAAVYFYPCLMGEHQWKTATCTRAKSCEVCGKTEGKALGHKWKSATCTTAKTCTICGKTEGSALSHKWKTATCTTAKTCTLCGKTEGNALGHKWKNATCNAPKTCTVCGKTEGGKLSHSWTEATSSAPATCRNCGETKPMDRPKTGDVFVGKGKSLGSTFRAINESGKDYYIMLKDENYNEVYSFYIRANEEKHVPVPSGKFYVYTCKGSEWYGVDKCFGAGKPTLDDGDLLDFNTYWWTYTLR